nr:MAG TPA: C2H2 type zinc-finger protein [Caudoviricetes sp.]
MAKIAIVAGMSWDTPPFQCKKCKNIWQSVGNFLLL